MAENEERHGLRIAFCTTCMNRLSHLQQTLPANLANNRDYENAVFVVLDYGDRQGIGDWVKESLSAELETGRLVYYREPERQYFQMAHAKNMAHRCALLEGADVLVNLDADNFTGMGFASLVNETFSANPDVFLRANKAARDASVGAGGRIGMTAKDFLAIGGYDEFYVNWGNDDWNLVSRLERRALDQIEVGLEFAGGIPHHDEARVENYQNPLKLEDFRNGGWRKWVERHPRDDYVRTANVSGGMCFAGCGTVYRNFQADPIKIEAFDVKHSNDCGNARPPLHEPRIIVALMSCPANEERLQAAEDTWLSNISAQNLKTRIVSGSQGKASPRIESNRVFLDCPEADEHLALKTYKLCQYFLEHEEFDFIIKCDDDAFVDLEALLNAGLVDADYVGWLIHPKHGFRESWHDDKGNVPADQIPSRGAVPSKYAHGFCYILSRKAVQWIAARPLEWIESYLDEDVMVGAAIEQANESRTCRLRIEGLPFQRLCCGEAALDRPTTAAWSRHPVSPDDMKEIYREMASKRNALKQRADT